MLRRKFILETTSRALQCRGMAMQVLTLDSPSYVQSQKARDEVAEKYERSRSSDDLKVRFRKELYMRPFIVSICFSKTRVHAKIIHRTQQRTIASVCTTAKDLRQFLPSKKDVTACRMVGEILATRAKEADCYAVVFTGTPKLEGRAADIIRSLANCGISVYHEKKGLMLSKPPSSMQSLHDIIQENRKQHVDEAEENNEEPSE